MAEAIVSAYFKFIMALLSATFVISASVYGAFFAGYSKGYAKKEADLKECAEEVSKGCPNVTSYAIMLEAENARLNKLCRKSKP